MNPIAVVRIKGRVNVPEDMEKTLEILGLRRKHVCRVFFPDKSIIGAIKKVEKYITWGEIDKETFKELLKKRGRLVGDKKFYEDYIKEKLGISFDEFVEKFFEGKIRLKDVPGLKPFFRLSPPKGGFERGGLKKPFSLGGAYGYRGKYVNDLLRRMM